MRIAMLTNNYKPFIGGVPISIERLSNGLRALGCEVYIFTPSYKNQVEEEYVIRYNSFKATKNGLAIPNMMDPFIMRKFKELEIDLIHVHHPMLIGWTALYLGKKYKIPVIYTYHTRYEHYLHNISFIKSLESSACNENTTISTKLSNNVIYTLKEHIVPSLIKGYLNKCQMVFVPTELMHKILASQKVHAPIEILPTGLDTAFFQEDKDKVAAIRKQYIGDKGYLFCSVSRLEKEKNISFMLEGLEQLKNKIGNNFKMLLIGDGTLKEILKEEISNRGLDENIILLNSIPNAEIPHYYGACDLFLFASKSETQGIVLLEAMATRTPVIAIEATGVVDVVKNHINGFMTLDSHEDWVGRIIYLINHKSEWEKLKEGAYETASKYANKRIAQRALCHYKSTIKSYHKQASYLMGQNEFI